MSTTNKPLFIVRGPHSRFEVNTVIYANHYVKPDGNMHELNDNSWLGVNKAWATLLPRYKVSLPTYPN